MRRDGGRRPPSLWIQPARRLLHAGRASDTGREAWDRSGRRRQPADSQSRSAAGPAAEDPARFDAPPRAFLIGQRRVRCERTDRVRQPTGGKPPARRSRVPRRSGGASCTAPAHLRMGAILRFGMDTTHWRHARERTDVPSHDIGRRRRQRNARIEKVAGHVPLSRHHDRVKNGTGAGHAGRIHQRRRSKFPTQTPTVTSRVYPIVQLSRYPSDVPVFAATGNGKSRLPPRPNTYSRAAGSDRMSVTQNAVLCEIRRQRNRRFTGFTRLRHCSRRGDEQRRGRP